ncbi:thioesterase family protein [Rhodococcus erythropolis]|nr:thioesterase family protein [Rhodococcus erythropolis]
MADAAYFIPSHDVPADAVDAGRPERYLPTADTISIWSPAMQHGAPPSALLVRALERCEPRNGTRLTRVCFDILGPIPLTEIEVRSWIDRPGKVIELLVAELWATSPDGSERAVARATAWRVQTTDTRAIAHAADAPLRPRQEVVESAASAASNAFPRIGYVNTLEWKTVHPLGAPGPSAMWLRTDVVLVRGETPTPLERLFIFADVANGIGSKLDPSQWTYLNTDMTVHIFREPVGEWIGISAETSSGPDGVGLTAAVLYDEIGPVARSAQNVLIRPRPDAL